MRWKPRVTIRTLMIVVAIAAVALGFVTMRQRWQEYEEIASVRSFNASVLRHVADSEKQYADKMRKQAESYREKARSLQQDKESTSERADLYMEFEEDWVRRAVSREHRAERLRQVADENDRDARTYRSRWW